jgi:hypothetical protein
MYDCDFGFTYNDQNYDFTHVESVNVEDPERVRLTRGANAPDTIGITYKEGVKEAKILTITSVGLTPEIHQLLKTIYKEKARIRVYVVQRSDGSSKIAKNSVLSREPQQLDMDDTPESMNYELIFESFDVSEVVKA